MFPKFMKSLTRSLAGGWPGSQPCGMSRPLRRMFGYRKPDLERQKQFEKSEKGDRSMWRINLGILLTLFGLVYMSVPLYRKFCASMGLTGNVEQKDYSALTKSARKHITGKRYKIIFESEADPEMGWEFEPEQSELMVQPGETALMFYRAYNTTTKPIVGVATYVVYPEYAAQYFSKIQCFCFNQQLINAKEELLLPLYFYFEPEIEDDVNLKGFDSIKIHYRFFFNKSQDLAQMVQNQKIVDLNNKIKVLEKRKAKAELEGQDLAQVQKDLQKVRVELANMYSADDL